VVGHGLNTLFAHSYGGIIALKATTHGLLVNDLVLLSVPAESVPVEWRNIKRTVSLRIHMDLVLLAARRRQYFTENVDENYLPGWFWWHSDSHNPEIWHSEKCPEMLGLDPII
jgi:pimeloyl-ACP methyl ester carboxylesterase